MFDELVSALQQGGSSPFFFTSAIQSAVFGEVARSNQADLMNSNLDFRRQMQKIRDDFSKERLNKQISYRRESYELGRKYLIEQTRLQNKSRCEEIEFLDFLKSDQYWPLHCDVYSLLKMQEKQLDMGIIPLRVLIARTEVSTYNQSKPESSYIDFCQKVSDGLNHIAHIEVLDHPWKKKSLSVISESLNLNFIMQGIPTLLLFPYQMGETFGVEIAAWAFNRGRQSMLHSKVLKIENFDSINSIDKTLSIVKLIAGMMRDSYVVAEYHLPVQYPQYIDSVLLELPEVKEMVSTHYKGISESIHKNSFSSLCTSDEILQITTSLKSLETITA